MVCLFAENLSPARSRRPAPRAGKETSAEFPSPKKDLPEFLKPENKAPGNRVKHYYTHDGLGSVRTLTDASGMVKNRYDYTAFGTRYSVNTTEGGSPMEHVAAYRKAAHQGN